MSGQNFPSAPARRSFLARFGAAATVVGAVFGAGGAAAQSPSPSPSSGRWQPGRHAEDDWFDALPGQHRMFFDTISLDGVRDGLLFANNFFTGNRNGYGLENGDLAVVVSFRHRGTAFAFSDAMWAKYGVSFAECTGYKDPAGGQVPAANPFMLSLDGLIKRGVHFSVCSLATRALATMGAQKTGAKIDDVFQELSANTISNGRMVPAGIVAINRAQERGYSITHVG